MITSPNGVPEKGDGDHFPTPWYVLNDIHQIKDILERDRLPIIVGGTNYYIESVLYNVLIDKPESEEKKMEKGGQDTENGTWSPKRKKFENNSEDFLSSLADMNNATLHKKLKEIDPEMADVLHPNNRRKIIRWVSPTVWLSVKRLYFCDKFQAFCIWIMFKKFLKL